MKVVGRKKLEEFSRRHADVRSQLHAWLCSVEESQWQTPHDVKALYATASFLGDNRGVFNLKGNKYRLDVKLSYKNQVVLIKRIGTHAEYSSWKF